MVNTETPNLPDLPEILVGAHDNLDAPEARREVVARLIVQGYSQREIARRVGVSHVTIHHDVKKIRDEWKKRMSLSYEQHVAEEIAHISDIERQLNDAISLGRLELIPHRTRMAERKARLLGLDSPVKHEVSVVSLDALDHEIARLESSVGPIEEIEDEEILDAEIVE